MEVSLGKIIATEALGPGEGNDARKTLGIAAAWHPG